MFKVGNKVKIRVGSCYYGGGTTNPADVIGMVISNDYINEGDTNRQYGDYCIGVRWDVNISNVYRGRDLELVSSEITYCGKTIKHRFI